MQGRTQFADQPALCITYRLAQAEDTIDTAIRRLGRCTLFETVVQHGSGMPSPTSPLWD